MTDRPPSPRTRRPVDGVGSVAVLITDEQSGDAPVFDIDRARWSALVRAVLEPMVAPREAEVSVTFVDEQRMIELNEQYMGHHGATDVLAFPIDGNTSAPRDTPSLLGDVVVCPAVAARNAPDHAGTIDDEVALLVVHGALHLMGLDHAADEEREQMQSRERTLLDAHHGPLARDPWS